VDKALIFDCGLRKVELRPMLWASSAVYWAQTAESQFNGALAPFLGKSHANLIFQSIWNLLFPATRERALDTAQNALLAAMSSNDLALLHPLLEPLELKLRQMLEPANKPVKHNYFLYSGLASVIAIGKNGHQLEVGIIGREGMTGLPVVLGNDRSPNQTFIQVEGTGSRIAADDLRDAMRKSVSLTRILLNFVNTFLIQTSHTALSNGTASLEERLARWLLMAQDRLGGTEVPLTHEFLSLMLGVRRPGVTGALNQLNRKGVIRVGAALKSWTGKPRSSQPTALTAFRKPWRGDMVFSSSRCTLLGVSQLARQSGAGKVRINLLTPFVFCSSRRNAGKALHRAWLDLEKVFESSPEASYWLSREVVELANGSRTD
jgi:CRP-like cAMP-binding protein